VPTDHLGDLLRRDPLVADRVQDRVADEPMPVVRDPVWNAFWRVDPRPDGRRAPDGPLVDAIDDKFELIAAGQAVAIVRRAAGRGSSGPT